MAIFVLLRIVMRYLLVFLLVILPNCVFAGFKHGSDLEKGRIAEEKCILNDSCGYIGGVYEGYIIGIVDIYDEVKFCLPTGVKGGQLFAIVGNYVKAHPEGWQYSARGEVTSALAAVYPCSTN